MPMMTVILIVIVVGVGIVGIILMIRAQSEADRARQLSIISGRGPQRDDTQDKDVKGKRLADLSKKLRVSQNEEKKKEKAAKKTIHDTLVYAGLDVPDYFFWVVACVGGVVGYGVMNLIHMLPVVQIFGAVAGFFGIPRVVFGFMAGRRQKKFLEEFADGLESIVRLLKAGMPVGEAIAMVAREFSGPLGEEMGRVYESQKIGVPLPEAIMECAKRMPLPEVRMFATGITIQQQTGSSLSDVLINLASLIRARFRLKRKVQALSSEAKASAMIIGALPVIVATGIYFINPDYISVLFTTPKGKFYLSVAVGWMMLGVIVMRQMINFRV